MHKIKKIACVVSLFSFSSIAAHASIQCPSSHPLYSETCGQCFESESQAATSNCSIDNNSGTPSPTASPDPGGNSNVPPIGNNNPSSCGIQSNSGEVLEYTSLFDNSSTNGIVTVLQDVDCITQVGNGNDGCINRDGLYVSREYSVSNPDNTREALLDIEYNLGINIDDNFIAESGYQGSPPSINTMIHIDDARIYFQAVLGKSDGDQLLQKLNTDGNEWLDRNEATAAKGADPLQTLGIPSLEGGGGGLATDDVLAYVGLYFGDGALDKYAGDLGDFIMCNLVKFTRTWQPGTNAADARYDSNGRYIGY